MEAKDPLSDLADIHLPDAVSLWPPAPLWWMLAALLLAALTVGGVQFFRRWQRRQRVEAAIDEIRQALQQWQTTQKAGNDQASLTLLNSCNSVLKRVALVHYPEMEVAALAGRAWLAFLDQSGATTDFTNGAASVLADGSYRRSYQADTVTAAALTTTAQQWIRRQYQNKKRQRTVPLQAALP